MSESLVQITLAFVDETLDEATRQKEAHKLLKHLKDLDGVERVDRGEDVDPEIGSKAGWATLIGVLKAEVNVKSLQSVFKFLGDRLSDQRVKIRVKVGDKEIELEASSRQELDEAEARALRLAQGLAGGDLDHNG